MIVQSIENGGFKAPSFAAMVEANRLSWLKRLTSNTSAKWKVILMDLIKPMSIRHFTESFLDDATISAIGIPFYTQLYFLWNKMREKPRYSCDYLEQVIWKNKLIQQPTDPKKKSFSVLRWPQLYKAGICKVKDLFTPEGNFIDLAHFCIINNIKHNFLQIAKVKKAIPGTWVTEIKSDRSRQESNSESCINFTVKSGHVSADIRFSLTKTVYNVIILKKSVIPTSVRRWTETFEIDDYDWPSIYKQPYIATRETKLQSFQYKIINRIVVCQKWLHDQKVVDSPYCLRCNENKKDDIIHHFTECKEVNVFWNHLEKWWNRTAENNIKLTKKHIIFGFYYDNFEFECINCVLLIAKWHIQKQVYLEHRIDFFDFLVTLKQHLQIERYICISSDKLNKFNKKWLKIWDSI